jgi:hypothetical protein
VNIKPLTFAKDSKDFHCPYEDCPNHITPIRKYVAFLKHMDEKHGETWKVVDDELIKVED